jgi:hypothetical protein
VDVIFGRVAPGNLHVHDAHPFILENQVMARFLESRNGLNIFRLLDWRRALRQRSGKENERHRAHCVRGEKMRRLTQQPTPCAERRHTYRTIASTAPAT